MLMGNISLRFKNFSFCHQNFFYLQQICPLALFSKLYPQLIKKRYGIKQSICRIFQVQKDWIVPEHFVQQMSSHFIFERGKDRKVRKTVVYNNPPIYIFFQYLPFSTQPNHLKIADYCISM